MSDIVPARGGESKVFFVPATWTMPVVERNLMAAGLLLFSLSLTFLLLILADARVVDGNSTWLKPFKFSVSLGLHLATAALLWRWLSPETRNGWIGTLMGRLWVLSSLFELAYIASQAATGFGSHYNTGTPYTAMMYSLMGVGAVILVSTTFAAGVSVLRAPLNGRDAVMSRAIGLGFCLSGLLGLVTGVALSSNGGHFVGTPVDPGAIFPVLGWSREVGDIRVSHFVGLHALQVMPFIGLAAQRVIPDRAIESVHIAALSISAVCIATLVQALVGLPLV